MACLPRQWHAFDSGMAHGICWADFAPCLFLCNYFPSCLLLTLPATARPPSLLLPPPHCPSLLYSHPSKTPQPSHGFLPLPLLLSTSYFTCLLLSSSLLLLLSMNILPFSGCLFNTCLLTWTTWWHGIERDMWLVSSLPFCVVGVVDRQDRTRMRRLNLY